MKPQKLLLICIALTSLLGTANVSKLTPEKPGTYRYSGAWQPARVSANDGITALDVKIGRFINLSENELAHVIFNVNSRFPGSNPWAFWAVGDMSDLTPSHKGLTNAQHETYLTYMDQLGVAVFLEIFPSRKADTDVLKQIDTWLFRFKHHKSIAGFGIDLEYYQKASDSAAKAWDEKVKSHNPNYRLFLRHYDPEFMPPNYRGKGDLIFVDFASEGTVEDLSKGFAAWANRFAPAACAFQIGYPADEGWNERKQAVRMVAIKRSD